MYICSCHAVTDGQIKKCITTGEVCTWKQLTQKTRLGTQCGICAKGAKVLFDQLLEAHNETKTTADQPPEK